MVFPLRIGLPVQGDGVNGERPKPPPPRRGRRGWFVLVDADHLSLHYNSVAVGVRRFRHLKILKSHLRRLPSMSAVFFWAPSLLKELHSALKCCLFQALLAPECLHWLTRRPTLAPCFYGRLRLFISVFPLGSPLQFWRMTLILSNPNQIRLGPKTKPNVKRQRSIRTSLALLSNATHGCLSVCFSLELSWR